jgi:REP element-mobilizing transposase RayT
MGRQKWVVSVSGSYTSLHYHIVFSVKDRRPLLTPEIAPRVCEYIAGIVRRINGVPIIDGGTADHTHILCGLHQTLAISEALRHIKAGSSQWIHETFPAMADFAWQEGYGAFSVGVTGIERTKRYIENQDVHHQTATFQEEFLEFLARHDIPYDERYIWK